VFVICLRGKDVQWSRQVVAGDILPGLVSACAVAVVGFCPSAAGSAYVERSARC
jgi:hypothetical protein